MPERLEKRISALEMCFAEVSVWYTQVLGVDSKIERLSADLDNHIRDSRRRQDAILNVLQTHITEEDSAYSSMARSVEELAQSLHRFMKGGE